MPIAIHNNAPGDDEAVLKRFDEPAWNYPVVRYVDAEGGDLIERRDRVYGLGETAARMAAALEAAEQDVPGYLAALAAERPDALKQATFAMS